MPIVNRGAHCIHYDVHGEPDAPALLLIMGLGLSSRAWHTLPQQLGEHFHTIVFDNRGTGRSTCGRRFFRMRDLAEDAVAVLDALGIPRAFVFGISMGGMVALELALTHPERLRALALGCTAAGYLRSRKPSLAALRDLLLSNLRSHAFSVERLARLLISAEYFATDAERFAAWLRRTEHAGIRIAMLQLAAVALHATESRLKSLSMPTFVITGNRDRLIPPENSRQLARLIPNAQLLELEGAGHCFPVERERETFDALLEFFGSVPA